MKIPAIEFNQVGFWYDREPLLSDITFRVDKGDFLGVIGPNGGGKTTLLRLMMGLLQPQQGEIKILDRTVEKARSLISYVPQYSTMDPDFPILTREVVAMGALHKFDLFPWNSAETTEKTLYAMKQVSVENLAEKKFGSLSGGQRQRVLIARALISQPHLLLLDEPTASVDPSVEKDIYELLFQLKQEMTLVLVSHDLGFVSSYITKVACVNRNLVLHETSEISFSLAGEAYHGNFNMIEHHCHL